MTGNTLKELNVQVGDVVQCVTASGHWLKCGEEYTVKDDNTVGGTHILALNQSTFRIISRAKKYTSWKFTPAPENAETHTMLDGSIAWRVVVEPVIEIVTKYRHADNGGWTDIQYCKNPSHRLTYNTIDGVPDCAWVKMELTE